MLRPDASATAVRVACLEVPLFPLAARLRAEPELTSEALAVLEGDGDRGRVVAATRRARRAGIRPGQTLAQARARMPKLLARSRDPSCERAAQEALLDVAEGISPRVEDAGAGVAFLDATGLERHYPDEHPEHALAATLVRELETRAGLPAWVGIAGSKLAARVAAGQPGGPTVVPAGEEAAFLAPLPLERLSAESEVVATLGRWGVRSVGELARLPRHEVASRLGADGQALHATARGLDPQPLMPRRPPPTFREGLELEWPLVNLEPFVFVARAALERLTGRMASHGLACVRIELSLELEPSGHHERSIDLPAPTRDIKTLLTLLRLDLEATPPGAPVCAFTLTAHPDKPRLAQLSLFGPAALAPDKLATTVARLFALLGEGRAGAPATVDGHRPERFALMPFAPPSPPPERCDARPGRGLLAVRALRPALAIEVIVDKRGNGGSGGGGGGGGDGEGPHTARPTAIRTPVDETSAKTKRIDGTVRVASGPWGLEEGWWTEAPLDREYWDVEVSDGGLYRVYRDRLTGAWFADGIYD